MTQEADKRIRELCELITKETNSAVFADLIAELNQRLEEREKVIDQRIRSVSKQGD